MKHTDISPNAANYSRPYLASVNDHEMSHEEKEDQVFIDLINNFVTPFYDITIGRNSSGWGDFVRRWKRTSHKIKRVSHLSDEMRDSVENMNSWFTVSLVFHNLQNTRNEWENHLASKKPGVRVIK